MIFSIADESLDSLTLIKLNIKFGLGRIFTNHLTPQYYD